MDGYEDSIIGPGGTYTVMDGYDDRIIGPSGTYTVMDGYENPTTTSTTQPPKPPKTYYYCGDQKANNAQTQSQCRSANRAKPEDSCVRNDSLCSY